MFAAYTHSPLCVLAFIFGLVYLGNGVKINKLQVPEVIRRGAPVVLDCDFTLEAADQELVVKWFFNNRTLVYQWIPGSSKRPQDLGILKGRLNLEYEASVDANSIHRALHILEPGPDLSGNYTCSVSTFQSEDIRTKNMLVFVPEKSMIFRSTNVDEDFISVQCKAEGVFPRPEMVLRSVQRGVPEIMEVKVTNNGFLFDVIATATLSALEEPEEFICELRIPRTNYTKQQETVVMPGSSGNIISMLWWLQLTPCILLWRSLRSIRIDVC